MAKRTNKYTIEGVGERTIRPAFPLVRILFLFAIIGAAIVPFTSSGSRVIKKVGVVLAGKQTEIVIKEKIVTKEVLVEVPVEVKIPVIQEAEPKEKVLVNDFHDIVEPIESIATLSNSSNIQLKTEVTPSQSDDLASNDRKEAASYKIEYKVSVKVPKPATTLEELEKVNPALSSIFPEITELIESADVSPYFYEIYKNKTDRVKRDAPKLKALLSRHNFFDLQTILNMTATSGRRVMIMQADMDVVSDGSDGDRLPKMPDKIVNSSFYQPSTSYFWKKQTKTPNPMIKGFEARVKKATAELANPNTNASRKAWLKDRLAMLNKKIEDMKYHSYLIAEHDPFIVIPISMLTDMKDKFAPKVGDYAVVIYKEEIYPCIVGDGGPTFKVGEASLRMAKELNSRAGIYSRPVSDLSVTYLVFPNSRDSEKYPADYKKWRDKCIDLIGEIGGLSEDYELHEWTNTLPQPSE